MHEELHSNTPDCYGNKIVHINFSPASETEFSPFRFADTSKTAALVKRQNICNSNFMTATFYRSFKVWQWLKHYKLCEILAVGLILGHRPLSLHCRATKERLAWLKSASYSRLSKSEGFSSRPCGERKECHWAGTALLTASSRFNSVENSTVWGGDGRG